MGPSPAKKPRYEHRAELLRLRKAVKTGDLDAVKDVFENLPTSVVGKAVNNQTKTDRKKTLLMQAAKLGQFEIVKYLVENCNAELRLFSEHSNTCCADGDMAKVGSGAIHYAAQFGHLKIVDFLLKKDPKLISFEDREGNSVLSRAAEAGQLEVVRFLIEKKQAPIVNKKNEWSPVVAAASRGHLGVVKYLVGIASKTHPVDGGNLEDAYLSAAFDGQADVFRYLHALNPGFMEATTNCGFTALHMAAEQNRAEIVRFLVKQAKIDVTLEDNEGRNAFLVAADRGAIEALKVLIELCPDLVNSSSPNHEQKAAIELALKNKLEK